MTLNQAVTSANVSSLLNGLHIWNVSCDDDGAQWWCLNLCFLGGKLRTPLSNSKLQHSCKFKTCYANPQWGLHVIRQRFTGPKEGCNKINVLFSHERDDQCDTQTKVTTNLQWHLAPMIETKIVYLAGGHFRVLLQ